MILEVRIPGDLQTRFSELRILKGLRAYTRHRASWCKSRSSAKLSGGPCTSCYRDGNRRQRETELGQRKCARLAMKSRRTGKVPSVSASVELLFVSVGSRSIGYSGCGFQAWSLPL